MPNQFSLKDYYSKPQPTQTQFANDIYDNAAQPQNETLPYGGGTYNPSGGAAIFPTKPVVPTAPTAPEVDLYAKYRDPKTGDVMTPKEYAVYLGNKVPKSSGQIPSYAGDAVTNPKQTANELIGKATDLNNARNDIAVGETDPYKVGNKSGIAYSPSELKAIENAYAGIYDPALKDVFSRLRDKQAEDKEVADDEAYMRRLVLSTNEDIRKWNATTGTKSDSDSDNSHSWSSTQIANGAGAAGMDMAIFEALESDNVKNFYINPPVITEKYIDDNGLTKERKVPMYEIFRKDIEAIEKGEKTRESVVNLIGSRKLIANDVKIWLINRLPEEPKEEVEEEEKEGLWKGVVDKLNPFD